MADSEDILRLGIEAAREGNRDEARGLFTLLTNEDPDNVQAWLWLAGVAQGPEQRRAALEQVVRLDPSNEMALKGLQAMGVAAPAPMETPVYAAMPALDTAPPARDMTDEERYAAELDSAFDLADELPRAVSPPRRDLDADEGVLAGAAAASSSDERPRLRSSSRVRSRAIDDDDTEPARNGPSWLLWLLLGLILLALLGFLLWQLFFSTGGEAPQPTAAPVATTVPGNLTPLPGTVPTADPSAPTATADPNASAQPTVDPNAPGGTMPTADPNAPAQPTADPNAPAQPTADPNAPAQPTADPNAPAQPTPPAPTLGPVAGANPLIIPANAFITANGWNYTYPGANVCAFGCSVVLGNRVGNFNAAGTFLHVLVLAQNTTGTGQPLPAQFFVLRDAQGRTHEARVDVAAVAWQPGSADVSHAGNIPANGTTTSVYLVFDVPTDATNLVLFSRYFIDQGWQAAASVR